MYHLYDFFLNPQKSEKSSKSDTDASFPRSKKKNHRGWAPHLQSNTQVLQLKLVGFNYYCFNMALYLGQMSRRALLCPGSFYPVIIFTTRGKQAKRTHAAPLVLLSGLEERFKTPSVRKYQEGPLVPKMWSNWLRMSSTAWFW